MHEKTEYHLTTSDSICNRHIKKWTCVPRSGTNQLFQMQQGLGMPTIKALYEETHEMHHTAVRFYGDQTVNAALYNAVACEQQLVRKSSSVVCAEETHMSALNAPCNGEELSPFTNNTGHKEKEKSFCAMKSKVK